MKKILTAILFIMLLSASSVYAGMLYETDFEVSEFPGEYTKITRGHDISIIEEAGNRFANLKVNMSASQGSPYFETKLNSEGNTVIELSVRVKNCDELSQSAVIIKNSLGQTANVLIMQKGNIYAGNGSTIIGKMSGDAFYNIALALNFEKGTYSIYWDGQRKAKDLSFGTSYTVMNMAVLRFMTLSLKDGCKSEFAVDNISVYSGDEPLSDEEKENMGSTTGGIDLIAVSERVENVLFFYENTDKMYFEAQITAMPQKTFFENDTLYVPLKFIVEKLGGNVGWENGVVTVSLDGKKAEYKTDGKNVINKNGTSFISVQKLGDLIEKDVQADRTGFAVIGDKEYFYDWKTEQDMILETIGYINYKRPDGYEMAADVIKNSKGVHPRVVADRSELEIIKNAIANGEEPIKSWFEKEKEIAERELTEPVYEFKMQDEIRALVRIQQVLQRINRLGLVYHVTGDKKYAERGIEELMGFCGYELWPDWNPYQMLGMGEAAFAAAIGYDWFYHELTIEERAYVRKIICEKAFVHYMNDINELTVANGGSGRPSTPYANKEDELVRSTLFKPLENNWNAIVNGGIMVAALTICDEEDVSKEAEEVLGYSIIEIEKSMKGFAPDGAWYEGAGYWSYMMQYIVRTWEALDKACKTDYGLANAPAMKLTGDFIFGIQGPGGTFNFSDANASKIVGDNIFYIAKKYNLSKITTDAEKLIISQGITAGVENITDYLFAPKSVGETDVTLDNYWRTIETVTLRNSWDSTDANFIGLHGGSNAAVHSHLDTGSIVIDALGTRIIEDIGSENYNLKSAGGTGGFLLYRLNPQGHNMICFNPSTMTYGQNVGAGSYITEYKTNKIDAFAITDLTDVWGENVYEYKRGIRLTDERNVFVIQDEYKLKTNVEEMYWFAHTTGDIEISEDKKSAKITVDNVELHIELLTDNDGEFMELPAQGFEGSASFGIEGQNQNIEYKKLAFRFNKIEDGTFAVACIPGRKNMPVLYDAPEFTALSEWELKDDSDCVVSIVEEDFSENIWKLSATGRGTVTHDASAGTMIVTNKKVGSEGFPAAGSMNADYYLPEAISVEDSVLEIKSVVKFDDFNTDKGLELRIKDSSSKDTIHKSTHQYASVAAKTGELVFMGIYTGEKLDVNKWYEFTFVMNTEKGYGALWVKDTEGNIVYTSEGKTLSWTTVITEAYNQMLSIERIGFTVFSNKEYDSTMTVDSCAARLVTDEKELTGMGVSSSIHATLPMISVDEEESTITATITTQVFKDENVDKNYKGYFATYTEDGRLISVKSFGSTTAKEKVSVSETMSMDENTYVIKTFLWDNDNEMVPVFGSGLYKIK